MRFFILSLFLLLICILPISAQHQTDSIRGLEEVVVTGSHTVTDIRHLPMTVTVIDRAMLTQNNQSSILPTVMQQVPGLFLTSRGMMGYGVSTGSAGSINMRGINGAAGQLMVLIDGHPQYQGIYGHPISDSYQTMMAERVEVLRGPASVLYGSNAMGGVLNIVTRKSSQDGISGELQMGAGSYGTIQSELTSQMKLDRFNGMATVEYNRSDNHRPRMGFEQYGGNVKLGYDFNAHWNAYLNANFIHFNASYPGSTDKPMYDADQWIDRGVMSAALENHYDHSNGALSVYYNYGQHKIDDGTTDPTNPTQRYFRSRDALAGVSIYQCAQLFEGNRITLGFDYQHIYGHAYYTSKSDGKVMETPNKQSGKSHRNEVASYVDIRQDITQWLSANTGIRVDHHSVSGTEWVPQVGLVTRIYTNAEIKAMASKGFRNPTMREMYLYPPSNEELKPERLWNYELSWRHRPGNVKYGVNLFYIKGDNLIQTIPVENKPRNVNTGVIENYGAELEASCRIDCHWNLSTNHSFLHMKNKVVASPEYKGFIGASFTQKKWNVIVGCQYVNGLYTVLGENEKKEDFCLLDATVNYQMTKNLRFWLHGENLLSQRYEIIADYPMPKTTFMAGLNVKF